MTYHRVLLPILAAAKITKTRLQVLTIIWMTIITRMTITQIMMPPMGTAAAMINVKLRGNPSQFFFLNHLPFGIKWVKFTV